MLLKIQKWGNSAAVRLPTAALAQSGLSIGDVVDASAVPGALTLSTAKPKYALADLVEQCKLSAPLSADMAAWVDLKPVGAEVL